VERARPGDCIALLARERGVERLQVGADFPSAVLRQVERRGLEIEVLDGSLFPEREIKACFEAAEIKKGNAASAAGLRVAARVLREAHTMPDGTLHHNGRVLTSERLRELIDIACLEHGARANETIVAGGDQACDPHGRGSGPLRANELIIVDIFPRLVGSGYHGDMTRTFLKGTPSDAQRGLVDIVGAAQRLAIEQIRAGADGVALYHKVRDYFTFRGYPTEKRNGLNVGFIHGLGHGLGLEVHEPPRMSRLGATLREGHVVTVEPGLYYPGLGGCRIEDVVWVTETGCEMLSEAPYDWVL
jgi:Xaa-Pro aminopeptidase